MGPRGASSLAGCLHSWTNEGVDFQRCSRIPLPWSRPAGGVGGCVRNIGRGEPRSPIGFCHQCDARPNAGRTDAAFAPVWSWTRPAEQSRDERKLEIGNRRGAPTAWSSCEDRASCISERPILLRKKNKERKRVREGRKFQSQFWENWRRQNLYCSFRRSIQSQFVKYDRIILG